VIPTLRSELTPQYLIDLSKLGPEQMSRVNQIVATVSFGDTNSLMAFGADAQRELSKHLDELLSGVRTGDTGQAGDITIELATTLKRLKLQDIKKQLEGHDSLANTVGKLPLIGGWFNALRYLRENSKDITDHLDTIEAQAQKMMTRLRSTHGKLDELVNRTLEHIRSLELYMAGGQILVKRARVEYEQRRAAAAQTKDVVEISQLRDFAEQLNAFESRLVKIHIAHSQSLVSVPEIRASQSAASIEMSNLMDSLLFDLPQLKRTILKIASLAATSDASKANDARRELSRELSAIGNQQLEDVFLKAKSSQGNFDADIALLATSADKLLQTIEMGRRLDEENRGKRETALNDLQDLNQKFTQGLISAGNAFVTKRQDH